MSTIFINLPVVDVQQSIAFYKALWFSQNLDFSNESWACMVRSETIYVMLLAHDFYATFLPAHKKIADSKGTSAVLNALQLESKEAVDTLFDKAIWAWGKQTIPPYDHWFMYGKDFEDIDGHIWEVFWMDASQAPQE